MIVRMKKITLLCVASARDAALEALRDLGVLHLLPVAAPMGEDLDRARDRLVHVRRALEVLPCHPDARPSGRSPDEIVQSIWDLLHCRTELEQTLEGLEHEQQRLTPYGSFDPAAIRQLAGKGVFVKLYQLPRKEAVVIPDDAVRVTLHEDKQLVHFAVIRRGDFQVEAHELRLPEQSLAQVNERMAAARAGLAEIDAGLREHAGDCPVVKKIVDEAEERARFLEARAGMGVASAVAYLRGFCPVDTVENVRTAAAANGWGLIVDDPAADDARADADPEPALDSPDPDDLPGLSASSPATRRSTSARSS